MQPMTKEGYYHWSRKIRGKVERTTYTPLLRLDVMPEYISSVKAIEELFLDYVGYEGDFMLKLWTDSPLNLKLHWIIFHRLTFQILARTSWE